MRYTTYTVISDKQFQLLEIAYDQGGIDYEMGKEIYWHNSTVIDSLKDLEDKNMVKREDAPPSSSKQIVFFLTEYGKSLVKSQYSGNSDD